MFAILLVIFLIVLLGIVVSQRFSLKDDRVLVEAFDGRRYLVRDTPDKDNTANTLARLNYMVEKFISLLELAADNPLIVSRLKSRYRSGSLSEGRVTRALTSYTINKGEKVVLCMRSRDDNDTLYPDEILFSIVLHELAHVASITVEHGPEFRRIHKFLEEKAVAFGMLHHKRVDINYCGIMLSHI